MNFRLSVLLTVTACAFFGVSLSACRDSKNEIARLDIRTADGRTVPVMTELARTEAQQQRGYMQRKKIPEGTGMIFINRSDRKMSFWMKDTPTALSIAFIDSSGTIREIYDLVPFSLEVVPSLHSLRYALEVPSGWFTRSGIAVGDRLTPESLSILTAN